MILTDFLTHRALQEYPVPSGKIWKINKCVNISKTVRYRVSSSEFLTHRVVQEYPMLKGKIQLSPLSSAFFLAKNKSLKISP